MNQNEKQNIRTRIMQWKRAGAVMEKIRRDDLAYINIGQIIEDLDDAFESALLHMPLSSTSGLVEQQAWFSRLNR